MSSFFAKSACTGYLACALLAGCASAIMGGDSPAAAKPDKCSFDETYSCVERMGHPVRCFCADKDTLRELLEPTFE